MTTYVDCVDGSDICETNEFRAASGEMLARSGHLDSFLLRSSYDQTTMDADDENDIVGHGVPEPFGAGSLAFADEDER